MLNCSHKTIINLKPSSAKFAITVSTEPRQGQTDKHSDKGVCL